VHKNIKSALSQVFDIPDGKLSEEKFLEAFSHDDKDEFKFSLSCRSEVENKINILDVFTEQVSRGKGGHFSAHYHRTHRQSSRIYSQSSSVQIRLTTLRIIFVNGL
jgi:hypothetical protein